MYIATISYYVFFLGYIQKGTTSTPPKILKSIAFPSITGKPATGPILPNPKIAVPSVTIVQIFDVLQYGLYSWINLLRAFSEKNGDILCKSLNLSSIPILPKVKIVFTIVKFMKFNSMIPQWTVVMHHIFELFVLNEILADKIFSSLKILYFCKTFLFIFYQISEYHSCFWCIC